MLLMLPKSFFMSNHDLVRPRFVFELLGVELKQAFSCNGAGRMKTGRQR